jgi:hypothetical protein
LYRKGSAPSRSRLPGGVKPVADRRRIDERCRFTNPTPGEIGGRVAAYDRSTGAQASFEPVILNASVFSSTVAPGTLVIAGSFTAVDGVSQSGVAVYTGTP